MPDGQSAGVTDRSTTTEYGVSVTIERGSKFIWAGRRMEYWSPDPTSEDEAIEFAREEYDGEIEEIHDVRTRQVPTPEKWDNDDPRILPDGGTVEDGIEHVDGLEPGDRVEFEASGTSGIPSAVVTDSLIDPVFPPEADDQIPGSLSVALKNPETQTIWNFSEEIDPDTGLTGEIEVSVKACIDIRHPPRYRWRERGNLVSCEVVGRETSVIESTDSDREGDDGE